MGEIIALKYTVAISNVTEISAGSTNNDHSSVVCSSGQT